LFGPKPHGKQDGRKAVNIHHSPSNVSVSSLNKKKKKKPPQFRLVRRTTLKFHENTSHSDNVATKVLDLDAITAMRPVNVQKLETTNTAHGKTGHRWML
jgi:hypothetical protein